MDKVIIKGLKVFAYHGVNPEEKENGQNFVFDIELGADLSKACNTDDLNDTVNYAKVSKTVRRVATENKYDLIERVAELCCEAIFEEHSDVKSIRMTLKKPEAPMKADFEYVGVEIFRER